MTRIEIPRSAFPLQWPPGVARAKYRESARFHGHRSESFQSTDFQNGKPVTRVRTYKRPVSIAEARDAVRLEIQRLGATDPVVLSTNLRLKNDGDPKSNQIDPADPGAAVYFKLDGRETCIAIDRFDRVADNLRAVARTIEAMRGIERWGGASLVAAAFTGFQALPEKSGGVGWWEVLGLESDAPIGAIETKARALRAQFHPDLPTGDATKFNAVSQALDQARSARGVR